MLGNADEEYLLYSAPTVSYTGSTMNALQKASGAVSGIVAQKVMHPFHMSIAFCGCLHCRKPFSPRSMCDSRLGGVKLPCVCSAPDALWRLAAGLEQQHGRQELQQQRQQWQRLKR